MNSLPFAWINKLDRFQLFIFNKLDAVLINSNKSTKTII